MCMCVCVYVANDATRMNMYDNRCMYVARQPNCFTVRLSRMCRFPCEILEIVAVDFQKGTPSIETIEK